MILFFSLVWAIDALLFYYNLPNDGYVLFGGLLVLSVMSLDEKYGVIPKRKEEKVNAV